MANCPSFVYFCVDLKDFENLGACSSLQRGFLWPSGSSCSTRAHLEPYGFIPGVLIRFSSHFLNWEAFWAADRKSPKFGGKCGEARHLIVFFAAEVVARLHRAISTAHSKTVFELASVMQGLLTEYPDWNLT